ncbi:YbjQ family protein [Bacteroidota bacterium]
MIIVTTETIPGKEILEVVGIVRGSTVRARNVGRDIFAGLKNLVGGEVSEYTQLLASSREEALKRMIQDAERQGANAVVNVRFTTSTVMQGTSEILAYGTGVKIRLTI